MGDPQSATEQAQDIPGSAESCRKVSSKSRGRPTGGGTLRPKERGSSGEGGGTACPLGRGLHRPGHLWRVLTKVVDELLFKGSLLTSKEPSALEIRDSDPCTSARDRAGEERAEQAGRHPRRRRKRGKRPGARGAVLLPCCCGTDSLRLPRGLHG